MYMAMHTSEYMCHVVGQVNFSAVPWNNSNEFAVSGGGLSQGGIRNRWVDYILDSLHKTNTRRSHIQLPYQFSSKWVLSLLILHMQIYLCGL